MKRCLIIDDEDSARQLLREYVGDQPQITTVAEAIDGPSAIVAIDKHEPDFIFLDIEMPGKNGFEVLDQVRHVPQVIFSTAFDNYAIQAFEVHAMDYLLKPYTQSRFEKAIQRLSAPDAREKQIQLLETRRQEEQ
ncbi:MAG: response regulator, partial [Bacteroidetes bacterium]|nr:response regulator [Bacteroidota bacterium]